MIKYYRVPSAALRLDVDETSSQKRCNDAFRPWFANGVGKAGGTSAHNNELSELTGKLTGEVAEKERRTPQQTMQER